MQQSQSQVPPEKKKTAIQCPRCGSDAWYRYGHTAAGRQRYFCLCCNRQFCQIGFRRTIKNRPACPHCERPMHVYKREAQIIRFRCANYPLCRTFQKIVNDK
jgi:transposase-like protein